MNRCKYYRREKDGRVETKEVEVTQLKKELYRRVKVKKSIWHPNGVTKPAQRIPTVAQVNRAMVKAGWTRTRLWTVIEARKPA